MQIISKIIFKARVFPSILLYFVMRDIIGIQAAAVVAGAYAVYYTLFAISAKRATKLDYGMIFFWGAGLVASILYPEAASWYFKHNFTSCLYFSLFLAAVLPLVFGAEPFTTAFAKRQTAQSLWKTEQFLDINRIMTACWAGLLFSGMLLSLLPSVWFKVFFPVGIMLFVGIPLNKKFPDYYQKKSAKTEFGDDGGNAAVLKTEHVEPVAVETTSFEDSDAQRSMRTGKLGPIKKAIIIFGSPRGKKGHTYRLLERFMAGMAVGGIECEFISLVEKKIKPCTGCFTCWTKTPGICIHKDDMPELLEKTKTADLVVYAQPLYTYSVPGIMKNFLDRSLPKLEPYLRTRADGSTRHPMRWRDNNPERMVVFSVCGFPEIDHFAPLRMMYKHLEKSSGATIVGEILRTASESLIFQERFQDKYTHLMDQLYEAGLQLATQGYVSRKTEHEIARPFFHSVENFRQVANQSWDTLIEYEEKKTKGELVPERKEYMLNHPRMLFAGMASMYDAERGNNLQGVLQFEITDREEGQYFFEITPEKCQFKKGKAQNVDLKIITPWDVWRSISFGEISGEEAFQKGLYKAEGDLSLLMKMRAALH